MLLLGKKSVKTFPWQRRIIVNVFSAVRRIRGKWAIHSTQNFFLRSSFANKIYLQSETGLKM
jgi:hypothetical protein